MGPSKETLIAVTTSIGAIIFAIGIYPSFADGYQPFEEYGLVLIVVGALCVIPGVVYLLTKPPWE